jgi:hypothetical protein
MTTKQELIEKLVREAYERHQATLNLCQRNIDKYSEHDPSHGDEKRAVEYALSSPGLAAYFDEQVEASMMKTLDEKYRCNVCADWVERCQSCKQDKRMALECFHVALKAAREQAKE